MNNKSNKVNAAVIIIGNEILSGRTKETNLEYISVWLNSLGVKVEESRIILDIENEIINCVNELRKKYNYVFTTGGIGPTHDDITAESVSKAFNLKYEIHKEAFAILEKYYKPGEFNESRQKMAKIPSNARLIFNPSSGAPGFIVENVFCLPGIPSILQSMLGNLKNEIQGGKPLISKTINLRTIESEIAVPLKEIQKKNNKVEIGSYPFIQAGKVGVAIVLRSEDKSKISICNEQILELITGKKIQIINRD
jgi:molybdenum cofactor synthesis domain-containing protein